ncbi:MAG: dTDP-4-dehydrorhamnose reductase [Moorella sp. (in: firmicutes)]|uniref:dTDP-4-dehydrorhamnose reductase n=1 Tax=Neomoorella thermoacetica TaxID=1525 RepID=A0A1J5N7E7_NEOTH|nr:dTDP-4-dehydrorhamnose reductase [Moorella sp. (in: firmicutes)]OIQ54873.1 dTDP-4-dehydrorhamnose reductase [Moorella thermoacetica]
MLLETARRYGVERFIQVSVDRCELDHDRAYLVNALGTRNVAAAAAMVGAKLIFISTDYVFNGRAGRPYTEFDPPAPINIYGKSKLAGDLARFIAGLIETELYGIYHASNGGECSWFGFAREIFRLAGLDHVRIRPISLVELNRPAPRPAYSVLDNYCIKLQGLPDLRCWQEALRDFLKGEVLS